LRWIEVAFQAQELQVEAQELQVEAQELEIPQPLLVELLVDPGFNHSVQSGSTSGTPADKEAIDKTSIHISR
jgi:hypothetical protein